MSASVVTMGDDNAPAAAPTKLLPSPLRYADGTPVPCSCKVSKVCVREGGRKASSGYWNLAPTSKAAKFSVQKC